MSLHALRQERADAAFVAYEFPDGICVEDASGWEYTTPGREMARKVFFTTDAGDGASKSANFTVTFDAENAGKVVDAGALTCDGGCELGHLPEGALERINASGDLVEHLRWRQRSGRGPAA